MRVRSNESPTQMVDAGSGLLGVRSYIAATRHHVVVNTARPRSPAPARELQRPPVGDRAYTLALAAVVLTAGSLADRLVARRLVFGKRGSRNLFAPRVAGAAAGARSDLPLHTRARIRGIGGAAMFACRSRCLAQSSRRRAARPRLWASTTRDDRDGSGGARVRSPAAQIHRLRSAVAVCSSNCPIGSRHSRSTYLRPARSSRDRTRPRVDWLGSPDP